MENIKQIELRYFDRGEQKTDVLNIRFVCQRVHHDYSEMNKIQAEAMQKWTTYKNAVEEITRLAISDEADKREKIKKLREEAKEVNKFSEKFDGNAFHEMRVKIIQRILRDNGYESDYSNDFFYDQMNPADMNAFLTDCIYKDIPSDKKKG
jgi:hypothetical protein